MSKYQKNVPSIKPLIHPPIGGGVSANHKSSNRTELSQLGPYFFDFKKFDISLQINPPIGGDVFTNHKSLNRIELSQLGQDFFEF